MSAVPKSFLTLGASWRIARMRRRLRQRNDVRVQQATWRELTAKFATTLFGRVNGVKKGMTYAEFRDRVPVQSHARLSQWIEQSKLGQKDVLWPGVCTFYATTAGTSGDPKLIPVTAEMFAHFRKAELDALYYYAARVGHAGIFRGRHLFVGASTKLTATEHAATPTTYCGGIAGMIALNFPKWYMRHHYEPGPAIAEMDDWQAKLAAIAAQARSQDVTLLAGSPPALVVAAHTVRAQAWHEGFPAETAQDVWPNLECVMHGGVPIDPFQKEMREEIGSAPNFHEIYMATEGFIAAQDSADAAAGLRLMTGTGLFFEFLPIRQFDDALPAGLGAHALRLEDVKVGEDYAVLLTTPGGLCRYVLGDVVRFTSTRPPRILYVGRTDLQLNRFGEHVSERDVTDALVTVCRRHDWTITNFHVAPLSEHTLTGQQKGHHEWWIELIPGTVATPTGPVMAAALDAEVTARNHDYEAKRRSGALGPPVVRLVMPGVFEHWQRFQKKWGGQHKMPRCRSDRQIADHLAQVARFHED